MKKIRKTEITGKMKIRHSLSTCSSMDDSACRLPGISGRLIECMGQSESIGFTFPGIC